MKRVVCLVCIVGCLMLFGCSKKENSAVAGNESTAASAQGVRTLTISGFGLNEDPLWEYILKPFEKQFNAKIILESGNNSERLTKVTNNPNTDVDIIYLAQSFAQKGFDEGAFEKLDYTQIPNAMQLHEKAHFLVDQKQGPAYTWNRLGIIYDPAAIGFEITAFSDLWRPELRGKISIPDISTTFGPAMVVLAGEKAGVSYTEDGGTAAFGALAELSPNIVKTYTKSSDLKNMFINGEIVAAVAAEFAYNSLMKSDNVNAVFIDPEEGSYLNFNTVNIVKNSKEKDLAYAFINYLVSPEVQLIAAEKIPDAPINNQVQLPENLSKRFTTAKEAETANIIDFKIVNGLMPQWVNQWNKTLNQ